MRMIGITIFNFFKYKDSYRRHYSSFKRLSATLGADYSVNFHYMKIALYDLRSFFSAVCGLTPVSHISRVTPQMDKVKQSSYY